MTCILEKRPAYFTSIEDYTETLNHILKCKNFITDVDAKNKYDIGLEESDFICTKCKKRIKIIEPDLPYKGQIVIETI